MRKPALLLLPLKEYGRLEFSFACGAECGSGNPLAFDEELPLGREADNIVLLEVVHVEKEIIGIIAAIEDKDGAPSQILSQEADAGTGNGIDRAEILFRRRMNVRKEADGLGIGVGEKHHLRTMVPLLKRPIRVGSITNHPQTLKGFAVRLDDVGVIDQNHRFLRKEGAQKLPKGMGKARGRTGGKMTGKAINSVLLTNGLLKSISNVRKESAFRSQQTVDHI